MNLPFHHIEKFGIGLGILQFAEQEFAGGHFIHRLQYLPQYPAFL